MARTGLPPVSTGRHPRPQPAPRDTAISRAHAPRARAQLGYWLWLELWTSAMCMLHVSSLAACRERIKCAARRHSRRSESRARTGLLRSSTSFFFSLCLRRPLWSLQLRRILLRALFSVAALLRFRASYNQNVRQPKIYPQVTDSSRPERASNIVHKQASMRLSALCVNSRLVRTSASTARCGFDALRDRQTDRAAAGVCMRAC
jgi:hypothetical protein